ncbi:hypothetical protein Bbelb_296130 [Branchiostoma belcheri]|nr:hypothetical protein Bbelb_296130 [Branchiostoma belcheri]
MLDTSAPVHFGTWTLRHLDSSAPVHFGTWTLRHLDSSAPGQFGIWTVRHLYTSAPGHLGIWTVRHLYTSAPAQFDTWTVRHQAQDGSAPLRQNAAVPNRPDGWVPNHPGPGAEPSWGRYRAVLGQVPNHPRWCRSVQYGAVRSADVLSSHFCQSRIQTSDAEQHNISGPNVMAKLANEALMEAVDSGCLRGVKAALKQ